MKRRICAVLASTFAVLAGAPASTINAHATPVCAGAQYLSPPPCPRVFPEPQFSTNWTQFGPDPAGRSEYYDGTRALQAMYPNYVKIIKLSDALNDPMAVSVGIDGIPPWDPRDKKDGLPLYVTEVTDFRVPDKDKAYVVITEIHSAEPCGREAVVRVPEDLAIWATDGQSTLDNGKGADGTTTSIKVADLLRKEKIFFVETSPDGWRSGDQDVVNALQEQQSQDRPPQQSQQFIPGTGQQFHATYSEENGRGVNTNRQAPSTGWMFRQPPPYPAPGQNPILTEPEGIATYRFLMGLKAEHGPMDGVMDIHGPLPFPADIMLPDGEFNPHHDQLLLDMASRVKQKMDESVGQHLQDPSLVQQLHGLTGPLDSSNPFGSFDWTQVGQVWDTINYTVTGAYGFWMAQPGGLGGVGTNYENNCVPAQQSDWVPGVMQFFVDSARAAIYTTLVQSLAQKQVTTLVDPKGQVGYIYNPAVLTDANNPSPPPADFPANPYFPHGFNQVPYRATSMKFLEDYSRYANKPFVPVNPSAAAQGDILKSLDTLVLVNHSLPDDATGAPVAGPDYFANLRSYVQGGGNLVLTDGAAFALSQMHILRNDDIKGGVGYVGYVDIQDHNHPFTKGLPPAARQMYDPVTIGHELRIERDGHWSGQPESGTHNDAPIWMVDRAAWEKAGGVTVATSDPVGDPKTTADEGTKTDKVSVGVLPLGKGRIVFIGALLPDPTDKNPHWFGLGNYGVTFTGHHIFQKAIEWSAPNRAPLPSGSAAAAAPKAAAPLPNTGRSPGEPVSWTLLAVLAGLFLVRTGRAVRRGWGPPQSKREG